MNHRYQVLLIDDEPEFVETLRDFLSKRGLDVESALKAEDGLAKLRTGRFDVAVIDLFMPVMNGLELVRIARQEGIDTSLIMMTGHGEKEDVVAALNLHVDHWFQKGQFKQDELLEKVRELAEGIPRDTVRKLLSAVPAE